MAKGKRDRETRRAARAEKKRARAGEGEAPSEQEPESVPAAEAAEPAPPPPAPSHEQETPPPPVFAGESEIGLGTMIELQERMEAEAEVEAEVEAEAEAEEEAEGGEEPEDEEERRLRRGMFRSRKLLTRPFTRAATRKAIGPEFWEEAEEAFIAADTGVTCAVEIVEGARSSILSEGITDVEGLKAAFRRQVAATLRSFGEPPALPDERPRVLFVVGVNGVGKTTTTAKIGYLLKQRGEKVLFAAADTFRAAGIEQMEIWAHRVGSPVVRHKTGGDPAAVVFDAIESAQAREMDTVLVDTAGRLHTKKNLMEELAKMWRVADRQLATEPQAILVIDATTGQNGVTQARIFSEALPVGSIALTKMDGSAKGGVVMAIGREIGIPVAYIGVGEGMDDLRPFDPDEYAAALF